MTTEDTYSEPVGAACPNCGTTNPEGATFCRNCGANLSDAAVIASGVYPVRLGIEYPERLSRLLIFVKWLLVIPHFLVLIVLGIAAWVALNIAFYSILFTKQVPRGIFDFIAGVNRWANNATAYFALLRDEYPPFSWEAGIYPLKYEVDYPRELNRWLPFVQTGGIFPLSWLIIFPFPLLLIPHLIILLVLFLAALGVGVIAWFAILFTGRYPESLFRFTEGILRWSARVNGYFYLLTDRYPPFSLNP